ncbi:hypothetical protein ABIB40_001245 [Pedobacter sp. UYP30]
MAAYPKILKYTGFHNPIPLVDFSFFLFSIMSSISTAKLINNVAKFMPNLLGYSALTDFNFNEKYIVTPNCQYQS